MKKTFLYWIFSNNQLALYVDDNGFVLEAGANFLKTNGEPAHLQHAPDGWKDTLVKYGRNIKYWGLFRDFTVPMNFKLDGAKISRWLMWNYGVEAVATLAISKLNQTAFPDKYEVWYTGELDFSKFSQKKTNVTLNVMEGGLSKYLKANENTTYDIPVDTDELAVRVLMDGLPFTNKINYGIFNNLYELIDNYGSRYIHVAVGIFSNEGSSQGILTQDTQPIDHNDYPDGNWFFNSESKNITISLTAKFDVTMKFILPPGTGTANVHFYIEKVNKNVVIATYEVHSSSHTALETFHIDFAQSIPMASGDLLYFLTEIPPIEQNGFIINQFGFEISNGSMDIIYDVIFDPTKIKGLYPLTLLRRIVAKMSDGKYTASSTTLDGMRDYVVTSGSAIRNHEGDASATVRGSLIKTSLSDFFKSFSSRFGLGLGIVDNTLVVEKIEWFFQNNVSFSVGEVDDFNLTVAEDLMFNTIKVGQANQTYDEVNGLDEFAVTQGYTTQITRIVKELDLTSPYRSDMYGIELTRLNLYGKDTTDNSADNDTFIINIGLTPIKDTFFGLQFPTFYYLLNRPAFSSITGLLHPAAAFNVLLSPKRALLNNGRLLHSVNDYQDANFITFQTGEKNSELSYTLGTDTVTEKSNIQISTLPAKLFLPYYFNFTTKVPFNLPTLMKNSPYAEIGFTYQGSTYTGYMWDGGIEPDTNDKQTWKLLAAPDNDMSNLINTI